MLSDSKPLDCLIVGGGPAGLTAAIYLARFHRNALVVDAGKSRALLIPESHNYPGFVNGITGPDLIAALRTQAEKYGGELRDGTVEALTKDGDVFCATTTLGPIRAKYVLMATGIVDHTPSMPGLHEAVYQGALRYCPICDAYEATDKRIGVIGEAEQACDKALFLRAYSRDVTLFATDGPAGMSSKLAEKLKAAKVTVPDEPAVDVERDGEKIAAVLKSGKRVAVDVLYPSLGCEVRSDLAVKLGATSDDVGCLHVDDKQRTKVEGLYAAGDVVTDLHQISVAFGHAAIAATRIHNSLPRAFR